MTELEIKIKGKIETIKNAKPGAYLATNTKEDDRIIYFPGTCSKTVTVLNVLYPGIFHMQENQRASTYTNLKRIKKITVEVELE